jgi:hypothetical protein
VILLPHKPGYLVEIEVDLSLFNDSAALETLVVKNWMLDELITLEPRSVPEQYNVSVVSMNRTYTIGILIGSTEKVDAEEIVEVLERDSEDKEGWTIISISREGENTMDLTADSEPEEESNVFFILLVLGGTVGILSIGLLLLMCNKRKHKIFSGPSKRTYSVPG